VRGVVAWCITVASVTGPSVTITSVTSPDGATQPVAAKRAVAQALVVESTAAAVSQAPSTAFLLAVRLVVLVVGPRLVDRRHGGARGQRHRDGQQHSNLKCSDSE